MATLIRAALVYVFAMTGLALLAGMDYEEPQLEVVEIPIQIMPTETSWNIDFSVDVPSEPALNPYGLFYTALWYAESSFRHDAPAGDGDNIARRFQLRPDYLTDAGMGEFNSLSLSEEMMAVQSYMKRYAPEIWDDLGQTSTSMELNADAAAKLGRIHNGGPRGLSKSYTEAYGASIREGFMDLVESMEPDSAAHKAYLQIMEAL